MSRMRSSNNNSIRFLFLLLLATTGLSHVFAQDNKDVIPKNAHAKTYGIGWECDNGFQEKDKVCKAIQMPKNAYLAASSYGDGWKCSWGYRKTGETCVAINIPANAYLNSYGYDWKCDRGFKVVNQTCVAVKVPEHGYFVKSTYGAGWECKRGYLAKNDACIALQVPGKRTLVILGTIGNATHLTTSNRKSVNYQERFISRLFYRINN